MNYLGDCKPCLCPGNAIAGEINSFADTCQSRSNGESVCLNCSEGHGGDHCEFCIQDYYGTPANSSVSSAWGSAPLKLSLLCFFCVLKSLNYHVLSLIRTMVESVCLVSVIVEQTRATQLQESVQDVETTLQERNVKSAHPDTLEMLWPTIVKVMMQNRNCFL